MVNRVFVQVLESKHPDWSLIEFYKVFFFKYSLNLLLLEGDRVKNKKYEK